MLRACSAWRSTRPRHAHVTREPTASWGGIGLVALVLAACAAPPTPLPSTQSLPTVLVSPLPSSSPQPSPSPEPTGPPSPTTASGPDLPGVLVCEGSDFEISADVLREPANAELAPDAPALALREFVATLEAASLGLPMSGWRRVAVAAQSVTFLAHGPAGWVTATVTPADDGTWQFWEGGSCPLRIRLPDELGFATWRLDPADLPTPEDHTVTVLVTEIACASGRPSLGRLLPPVVMAADDAVTVAFAVRKLPGGQDCPSNPEARVVIQLAEPLGNRRLFDGSSFPAQPRT